MLLTGLVFGLISSLHCIGMCGPIAMMLPVQHNNPTKKAAQLLVYHLGRLTAYGLLGIAFGLLGRGLYLAGLQQNLSIIAGVVMIVIAITSERTLARYNFSKPINKAIAKVKQLLGKQFSRKTLDAFFSIGFLNGLLPCGLVYAALFGALAMQHNLLGSVYMLLFGLGTVPLMSVVVYASNWITPNARNTMQRIIPVVTVAVGVLFILRGLALDIPFISPAQNALFVQAAPNCH
jgi:sulfite exporter TauE/SafE